jgi:replicative DNA helicase
MKTLPHAPEIEMAVLGQLMLENASEGHFRLKLGHFYTRSHILIFQTIQSMVSNKEHVDPITVTTKLKDSDLLSQVGGASFVSSCVMFPAPGDPRKYIDVLEEKMRLRSLIDLSEGINRLSMDNEPSSKIIEQAGNELINFQSESRSGNMINETVDNVKSLIQKKLKGEKVAGLKTGIALWDKMLGGLNPRYYTLAARGGRGKTVLMEQIVDQLLTLSEPVAVFQKDMSLEMFILRMACRRASVPFFKFDLNYCNKYELEQIEYHSEVLRKSPIYLYSPSGFTVSKFLSIIKLEKKMHDIKAVFLDHVLNLDVGNEYRTGLTLASTKIRESVQETGIPHVILAQLNREAHNNERPTPAHIKEFDALYADCDTMIMLWSEKNSIDVPKNEIFPMKFLVNKNRYGTEFEDDIGFDRQNMTFKPLVKI